MFTFLFLVIFSDPANLTDLPKIPDGFLQIMGISSFGYLGGKLARKPGPIIDEITANVSSLVLTIRGRKLSDKASFKISDVSITGEMGMPRGSDPEGDSQPPEFYRAVTLTVPSPAAGWQGGKHYVKLINPDGQEAQWFYTLPSRPVISRATCSNPDNKLVLLLEGSQLSQKATFKIGTDEVQLLVSAVGEADDDAQPPELFKSLTLTFTKAPAHFPGDKPITITNPDKQSATIKSACADYVLSEEPLAASQT